MHTLRDKIKHILKKDAEKIADFVEDMHNYFPEQVEQMINEQYFGCHIQDEKMYEKAAAYFVNPGGSKGAKWDVTDLERRSGIDFDKKEYTELDFAYAANMMYSDYGDKANTDLLLYMAKHYLEDEDYPGNPSERAYCNAKKRIKYFTEN